MSNILRNRSAWVCDHDEYSELHISESLHKAADAMNDAPAGSAKSTPPADGRGLKRVSTAELMSGHREIIIVHEDREYRLRITQLGKLILTR